MFENEEDPIQNIQPMRSVYAPEDVEPVLSLKEQQEEELRVARFEARKAILVRIEREAREDEDAGRIAALANAFDMLRPKQA